LIIDIEWPADGFHFYKAELDCMPDPKVWRCMQVIQGFHLLPSMDPEGVSPKLLIEMNMTVSLTLSGMPTLVLAKLKTSHFWRVFSASEFYS
jgi:hypothetical protein